jgi:hypothetical protein
VIPGQHDAPLRAIEQRNREHSAQVLRKVDADLLPQMHDDFGVRRRPKAVSLRLEPGPQRAVIVDLAVEYDAHGAVLVEDRLVAARQIDDGESAHPQCDRALDEIASIVGTAMGHRVAHAYELLARRRCPSQGNDARDAAHQATISSSRWIFRS